MTYPSYPERLRRMAIELRAAGIPYNKIVERLRRDFPDEPRIPTWSSIRLWWDERDRNHALPEAGEGDLAARIRELREKKKLPRTVSELCDQLDRGPSAIKEAIEELRARGVLIELVEGGGLLQPPQPAVSDEPHYVTSPAISEGKYRAMFGVCADFHAGSIYARADVVAAAYEHWDWQRREAGLEEFDVYVAGNSLEGPGKPNFNLHEIAPGGHTMDGQFELLRGMIPRYDGITTWILTGDCHEGWWAKQSGLNVGMHLERYMADHDREDIRYLGFMEKDVVYRCPQGDCVMRLLHPGGGSAYALSYRPQKITENIQGGTKPDVLIIGHYHKAEWMPSYRGVEVLQAGCCQDQTSYMAKKSLAAHVGVWTVTLWLDETGIIRRFLPEWSGFFNREFYLGRREPVEVGEVRRMVPA